MKKVVAVLAVMLLVASTAFAGNWIVGAEYNNVKQNIDDTIPLSLSYSQVYTNGDFTDIDFASASIVSSIDRIKLQQELVSIGYQVSEDFNPYILIGSSSLKYNWNLSGSAVYGENETWNEGSNHWQDGIAGTILQGDFKDSSSPTFGFGITGDIKDVYKGVTLTYDVRDVQFNANNGDRPVAVLPDLTCFSVNTSSKVKYNAWSASLVASKEFVIKDNKFLKSLTPGIGYKFTTVAMNIKTNTNIPLWDDTNIGVGTEQNVKANLSTLLLGLKAKINDKWSASVNGMIGDEQGIGAKVCYSF